MILVSALCFGSTGAFARLMGPEFGIFYQGWMSSAIILIILFPIALSKKHLKPIQAPHRKWFTITMLFTILSQAPVYFSFHHLTLGAAALIFFGFYLMTTYAIGWYFLEEKITKIKILSFALSILGISCTFGLSLDIFSLSAMLLAALGGVACGGEISTSKKSTPHYSSLQLTMCSWALVLITHLPLSLATNETQLIPSLSYQWVAMTLFALSGLIGFWLVLEGFKYVEASVGGLIGLLEIIFATLFGVLFFEDQLTLGVIIGGTIILLAACTIV